jgi:phosphoadenosine phosphosulfate reductase
VNLPDLIAAAEDDRARTEINEWLDQRSAQERLEWAMQTLPGEHVLSSSFGAQSAAMLHLATRRRPEVPVVLIDTGYLFPETYRYADELAERLSLNLKVYRPALGIAWMEARHGRLWEEGLDGLERYNRLRKVEPMRRALRELGARTWIAGLRRSQSSTRATARVLELRDGIWKFHPIVDWTDRDVGRYLQQNDLPFHPLWDKGYVSIGDVHTTQEFQQGKRAEDTRFYGLKRECGLHYDQ